MLIGWFDHKISQFSIDVNNLLEVSKIVNTSNQARSQPQNSKGAPATSKGAHNLHPKKVVTKSPSQPITARGSGGAL